MRTDNSAFICVISCQRSVDLVNQSESIDWIACLQTVHAHEPCVSWRTVVSPYVGVAVCCYLISAVIKFALLQYGKTCTDCICTSPVVLSITLRTAISFH